VRDGQLRLMDERGVDLTIFSPRASAMPTTSATSRSARRGRAPATDLVHRVVGLYPERFAAVCQLPQSPGVRSPTRCGAAPLRAGTGLRRLQPQPRPERRALDAPPLTDKSW